MTERPAYYPRGIIISTSEQHPPGQSVSARTLLIEVARDHIDLQKLTLMQKTNCTASACHGWVHSLACTTYGSRRGVATRKLSLTARTKATTGAEHLRIPEVAARLWLGLQCVITYAREIGAIDHAEANRIIDGSWDAFIEIGREQAQVVEQENPLRPLLKRTPNSAYPGPCDGDCHRRERA